MSEKWTFDKPFHSTDEEAGYWNGGDTYIRGSYVESPEVTAAKNALNAQMAQKPNAYQSQWQQQLSDAINKITNREKFSYDVNSDALYQQYKDKYIQQGKMASADVMGQAAAMTGGYGNSYAATVGNQAYQAHLNNLNDVIPELYQMAYDRYKQEGQDLYNQYSLFADRDNTDYGRYRDTVGDWQTDRNFLANRFDTERNFDYGVFSDAEKAAQSQWNADYANAWDRYTYDSNLAYTDYRNSIADAQWQAELDKKTDDEPIVTLTATQEAKLFDYIEAGDYYGAENYLDYLESIGVSTSILDQFYATNIAPQYEIGTPKNYVYDTTTGKDVYQNIGTGYANNTAEHKLTLQEKRMR
jgi:hypothetical protein